MKKYIYSQEECPHKSIGKEIYCGTKTGDWICYDCGLTYANIESFKSSENQK